MKNKGITLLALIVTVIIMVILASVSINLIMSGGAIDKTKEAVNQYKYQADKEQFELAKASATNFRTGKIDEKELEEALEGWTYKEEKWISPNGNEFTLEVRNSEEKEKEKEKEGETSEEEPQETGWVDNGDGTYTNGEVKVEIGDIVNYTPTPGTYKTYDGDDFDYSGYSKQDLTTQTDLKWKVMGISEEGKIEIISDKPTTQQLYLSGAIGYNNGVNLLNDACKAMYSKEGVGTARSINVEDIEKHFTESGKNARDTYSGYNTQKTYTSNTYYPAIYEEEISGNLSGSENIENLTKENKKQNGDLTVNKTFYYMDTSGQEYIDNEKFEEMIFGTESYYWFASRCVRGDEDFAYFGLRFVGNTDLNFSGLFGSNDSGGYFDNGLRPVVSLESNINLESAGEGIWNIK